MRITPWLLLLWLLWEKSTCILCVGGTSPAGPGDSDQCDQIVRTYRPKAYGQQTECTQVFTGKTPTQFISLSNKIKIGPCRV